MNATISPTVNLDIFAASKFCEVSSLKVFATYNFCDPGLPCILKQWGTLEMDLFAALNICEFLQLAKFKKLKARKISRFTVNHGCLMMYLHVAIP